jgi:hypothetical protein
VNFGGLRNFNQQVRGIAKVFSSALILFLSRHIRENGGPGTRGREEDVGKRVEE